MINYFAVLLIFSLPLHAEITSTIHSVEASTPRDYGIVMGQTFTTEIRVATHKDCQLETTSLPKLGGAVSDYLEVYNIQWNSQISDADNITKIKLIYQVFKGVREPEILSVPALPLRFKCQDGINETKAPAWNFTLMPIIPTKTPDEAVILRGDLPLPDNSDNHHHYWLIVCLTGLLGLGFFALWRLGLPPFHYQASTFLQTAKSLKRLDKQIPTLETYKQAFKLVHAAFNETTKHTVFGGQLTEFLEAHPEYFHLQTELERFFAMSDDLFFAANPQCIVDYPLARLETLCRNMASIQVKKQ